MTKNAYSDWDTTPANNTDIGGIDLGEGTMLMSRINDALRTMMAQLKTAAFVSGSGATISTPTLTLKQSATPTPTAEGDIQWDTDDNVIAIGDGAATQLFLPIPASTASGDIEYYTGAKAKARLAKGTAFYGLRMKSDGSAPEWAAQTETIGIAVSDETTAITTGTAKVTFRMPYAFKVTAVRASLSTASSSGLPTFDIKESGTTILSTALTIDANEKTSTTAATAAVISDADLADDAEMTIDITTAGTGAKGAKIYLIGYKAS
jgi:hypothetical protein